MEELLQIGVPTLTVIVTLAGQFFWFKFKINQNTDELAKQEEVVKALRAVVDTKASKDFASSIKDDMEKYTDRISRDFTREISKVEANVKELNSLLVQILANNKLELKK